MKNYVAFLHLIWLGLTMFSGLLWAENTELMDEGTVTWLVTDFPPYHITHGDLAGHGEADEVLALLQEKLPQYRHRVLKDTPIARQEAMMKEGRMVASILLLKTPEREAFIDFSIPLLVGANQAIICRREVWEELGRPASLSLAALLANGKWLMGMPQRSYGAILNPILEAARDNRNIVPRTAMDQAQGLFQMMASRRIEWTIAYPPEAEYAIRQNRISLDYVIVPIAELAKVPVTFAYAGVPKTTWGRTLREAINQVLLAERGSERYRAFFDSWTDATRQAEFHTWYDKYFLTAR